MNAIDFLLHLLGFAAPAFALALVLAGAARWPMRRANHGPGSLACFAINFLVGVVVLGAGLWYFGRDGKMATYSVLVAAMATSQWINSRAWRS